MKQISIKICILILVVGISSLSALGKPNFVESNSSATTVEPLSAGVPKVAIAVASPIPEVAVIDSSDCSFGYFIDLYLPSECYTLSLAIIPVQPKVVVVQPQVGTKLTVEDGEQWDSSKLVKNDIRRNLAIIPQLLNETIRTKITIMDQFKQPILKVNASYFTISLIQLQMFRC